MKFKIGDFVRANYFQSIEDELRIVIPIEGFSRYIDPEIHTTFYFKKSKTGYQGEGHDKHESLSLIYSFSDELEDLLK